MGLKHPTVKSFKYAFEGLKTAVKREPNFRIHIAIAVIVLITAFILKLTLLEWILLAFTIFYVITLELLNTALEAYVNLVSPQFHPEAKIAKDVSAAMVLVAACASVIVGLILFVPKILALL
ncbi:MAG: Diacylglycerol kinase [Candidatus Woesebacteria bacterium GW2011_GWB1_39_12]|uniref:Diacylglycerol kinase n=2 Tax=Candidatus Woeseibacteriota TaxID=1752722 RepID=A0A0G0PK12_9BACT|nr:MAG: Diacylglycerol kinase [Candidatus Woesebacteria bacterium GW2011_GWA1_39_12]KKR00970.1 MAG: Diacylglycerol kinase [Candidatus Woesebacteria bacterium GW2011_GWB1_39_12]